MRGCMGASYLCVCVRLYVFALSPVNSGRQSTPFFVVCRGALDQPAVTQEGGREVTQEFIISSVCYLRNTSSSRLLYFCMCGAMGVCTLSVQTCVFGLVTSNHE